MDEVLSLIIPFITLSLLSVLIDRLLMVLERIVNRIPHLPDRFEPQIAYLLILIFSYGISYYSGFRFFSYLGLLFMYDWMDFLATALLISGGSTFIRNSYDMMNSMPGILGGLTSSIKSLFK